MVRLSFIPQDARYFDFFERAAANLVSITHAVEDLLNTYTELPTKLERIKQYEKAGDAVTHDVMRALNRTFITPLDREDITALVHALDDIADKAWAAAARLEIYAIPEPTDPARQIARILVRMAELLAEALPHLRRRSHMQRILPIAEQLNRLESEADEHLRAGLRSLYANPSDPRNIVLGIKWREILDLLEEATDKADDAANVLEAIVLKHG
jgi:predicted phosphate transport protein (TIGR00153 family)